MSGSNRTEKCDPESREPICQPLKTVEEVVAWQPGHADLCVARVSMVNRQPVGGPQTLVCHDMKGGYLDDRYTQGCSNSQAYRFYHWQYVDMFVYFSHHFVTIPPPGWTNVAHKHGTLMLGTVITEWADGKRNCEEFLKSVDTYKLFADKLVKLAQYYNFDGWLVNIENVIETPELVTKLCDFVKYLTQQQHKYMPGSKVIWYDSVTETGTLDWQNKLNSVNRLFFDASDGIFLNYCWTSEDLQVSKENAVKADRPYDVYVGIDVYGRGCLGGGGFNTAEALEYVRSSDLSAAIFGQGWTHEKLGETEFTLNENRYWQLINHVCPARSISCLPLVTSFCQGFGDHFFVRGKKVSSQPWYNQSISQVQPSLTAAQFHQSDGSWTGSQLMDLYTGEAYLGGASLCLVSDLRKDNYLQYRLFDFDVQLEKYPSLTVSYTYKLLSDHDCDLYLNLDLTSDNQSTKLVLGSATVKEARIPVRQETSNKCFVMSPSVIDPLPAETSITAIATGEYGKGWITRCYEIPSEYMKHDLQQLSVCVYTGTTSKVDQRYTEVLIGQVRLWPGKMRGFNQSSIEMTSVEIDFQPPQPLISEKREITTSDADDTADGDNKTEAENQPVQDSDQSESAPKQENICEISNPAKDSSSVKFDTAPLQEYRLFRAKLSQRSDVGKACNKTLTLKSYFKNSFTIHWSDSDQELVQYYNIYTRGERGVPVLLGQSIHSSFKVCRNGLIQLADCCTSTSVAVPGTDDSTTKSKEEVIDQKNSADAKVTTGSDVTDDGTSASTLNSHIIVQPVLVTGEVVALDTCPNFNVSLASL